jgi:hypothetical protein
MPIAMWVTELIVAIIAILLLFVCLSLGRPVAAAVCGFVLLGILLDLFVQMRKEPK